MTHSTIHSVFISLLGLWNNDCTTKLVLWVQRDAPLVKLICIGQWNLFSQMEFLIWREREYKNVTSMTCRRQVRSYGLYVGIVSKSGAKSGAHWSSAQ